MTNKNGSHWIRSKKRWQIYEYCGNVCCYCGVPLVPGDAETTLDHVWPREEGGSNDDLNLVEACLTCNSRKEMA